MGIRKDSFSCRMRGTKRQALAGKEHTGKSSLHGELGKSWNANCLAAKCYLCGNNAAFFSGLGMSGRSLFFSPKLIPCVYRCVSIWAMHVLLVFFGAHSDLMMIFFCVLRHVTMDAVGN